ncbi:MAG: hypothetical protein IJ202_06085 [Bacteroidales bacterium]|nr:hypothetical protein [Bacteroidales bacterium]MBQ9172159.1 hypothetical protein [Bacteroidales bacterium]MBQ9712861.1 hypothetical protein [Bacteroidales bacterium]MBR1434645.1 hypothetical protein [Bacteroidales bacterium]
MGKVHLLHSSSVTGELVDGGSGGDAFGEAPAFIDADLFPCGKGEYR